MDLASVSPGLIIAVLVLISLGSWIKGLTGMGLPLFAIPALATLTTVEEAVVLMIIPVLGSNLALVVSHRRHQKALVTHKAFLVAGFAGGIIGTLLLDDIGDRWLKLLLAAWLGLYLVQRVVGKRPTLPATVQRPVAAVVGAIAGAVQGATGVSAQIVAPYFNGRGLAPGAFAFLMATSFLTFSVAQLVTAAGSGLFTAGRMTIGVMALLPTLVFTRLGIAYSDGISQALFQRILLVVFVLMEIRLLWDVASPAT